LLTALYCWTALLAGTAGAGPLEEGVDPDLVYAVTHRASLDPESGLAHVSLELKQASDLVRGIFFRMPQDRYMNIRSDSPVDIEGDRVTWQPGKTGGTLRYDVVVEHRRSNGAADTRITQRWALLKLDHLFPAATTRALKGAQADARLVLSAPQGWSIETPYGFGAGKEFVVDNPKRHFDQPRGWAMAGRLAVRRDSISGRHVSVTSPDGTGFRANDVLSFLNWTLPPLVEVFPQTSSRLLIVSGTEDMWRGGLSGRSSLYMHPDRPLVSGNRTSTLLHELVHVASRMRSEDGADWIVEGIAEYYSLALLVRSGGISENRYNIAFKVLEQWSADTGCVATDRSKGKRTAAAALVMRALDEEIRTKTDNDASLDTLVGNLLEKSRTVTNAGFRAAAEDLVGRPVEALADCP
jgi:predicted metalloprotease with PDZ domain